MNILRRCGCDDGAAPHGQQITVLAWPSHRHNLIVEAPVLRKAGMSGTASACYASWPAWLRRGWPTFSWEAF